MEALHVITAVHVGQGAAHMQYAVIAARGELQALGRLRQKLAPGRIGVWLLKS